MSKFSIITICYNEEKLENTCKTIVNQSFQDFEWIVIDGGSNQKILNIFEKYKSRINYFVSEQDNGRYNAMNKGIKIASGEYLNFMNAGDCFYSYETLKKVNELMQNNKNKDIFYGNGYMNKDDKLYLYKKPAKLTKEYLFKTSLFHQSMFIKKALFNKFGLYDEELKIVSDWEHYFKAFLSGASFSYLNLNIAVDDANGISNNQVEFCNQERKKVLNQLFTQTEIEELKINNLKQNEYKKQIDILIAQKRGALRNAK